MDGFEAEAGLDGVGEALAGAGQDDQALAFGQGEQVVGAGQVELIEVGKRGAEDEAEPAAGAEPLRTGG